MSKCKHGSSKGFRAYFTDSADSFEKTKFCAFTEETHSVYVFVLRQKHKMLIFNHILSKYNLFLFTRSSGVEGGGVKW